MEQAERKMELNERIIDAMARFEVQVDSFAKTAEELSKTVRVLSDDFIEVKVKLQQISEKGIHTPLECQEKFDDRYVRTDNITEIHAKMHKDMLENTNLTASTTWNIWKIIALIAGAGFIWSIIVPAIH